MIQFDILIFNISIPELLFSKSLTLKPPSNHPFLLRKNRYPLYIALQYKEMIDSDEVKNQAKQARIKGSLLSSAPL